MRFFAACQLGRWSEVGAYLSKDPYLSTTKDIHGCTPLHYLVRANLVKLVDDVMFHCSEKILTKLCACSDYGDQDLILAAVTGLQNPIPMLKCLYRYHLDNLLNEHVYSAQRLLIFAYLDGKLSTVLFLLDSFKEKTQFYTELSHAFVEYFIGSRNCSMWFTALASRLPIEVIRRFLPKLRNLELTLITNSFEAINDGQSLPSAVLGVVMQQTSLRMC